MMIPQYREPNGGEPFRPEDVAFTISRPTWLGIALSSLAIWALFVAGCWAGALAIGWAVQ